MGLERAGGGGLKSLQKSEVQMQALMDDDGSSWVLCRLQSFETRTGALGLPSGKEVGKHSLKAPVGVQDIGLVFIPCLIPVGVFLVESALCTYLVPWPLPRVEQTSMARGALSPLFPVLWIEPRTGWDGEVEEAPTGITADTSTIFWRRK